MREATAKNMGWGRIIISTLISVIVSLGLILVFALLIKWFGWADNVIRPVNIAIKLISIIVGVMVATKSNDGAVLKGMIVGGLYIILSFVLFSLLLGSFSLSIENFWDLLMGIIAGAIVGVISNIIHK